MNLSHREIGLTTGERDLCHKKERVVVMIGTI